MLSLRIIKCTKLFKYKKWSNILLANTEYAFSTQPAIQSTQEKHEKQLKDFETLTTVMRKTRQKKPQKPPFAKNLFLGIFDTDVLTYPELQKEDTESLENAVSSVEKLMKQNHMINCNNFNTNFRQNLSDYKAIGLQASQLMDGRECNVSESSKFLEALSVHKLRDNIICNEQLGVQILVKFANDQLKKKYLHQVIKGNCLTAFCLSESELTDISSMKTRATLSEDKKTWTLNGEKCWVVNGLSADVLMVAAVSNIILKGDLKEWKLTLFLVEKNSPGISATQMEENGLEMANISFNNTPVPNENIIGTVDKAEAILSPIMTEFRLSSGSTCIALSKKILNELILSTLHQSNDSNMLYKTDAIRGKIGEITTNLYAMESVLYLTTGLIDTYENQDCELESILVKILCSQNCINTSTTVFDLIGMPATCESHWANKFHREVLRYVTLHETNDSLKIMSTLLGLQFAGVKLNDHINKIRNPLFHGVFTLKRMWTNRRNDEDNPKLNLGLGDYLHPSLHDAAQHLEYCVKRFEFASEVLLARFGAEVINQHMDLRRLADCILDIYIMTACLGRASRSYCIGLQNGNYEMLIASTFCCAAMERVKANVFKIYSGEHLTNDENYRAISKQIFKTKAYFPEHPLARNF